MPTSVHALAVAMTLLLGACSFQTRSSPPYDGDGTMPGGDAASGDATVPGDSGGACGTTCSFPDICGGGGVPTECGHPSGWFPIGGSEVAPSTHMVTRHSADRLGVSSHADVSQHVAVAVDSLNRPVVAWSQVNNGTTNILVRRFGAGGWRELGVGSATQGGISDTQGASWYPAIAIDGSDNPVIAWQDGGSGRFEIYVRRFDGSAWVEVGTSSATGFGISPGSGTSQSPSLTLDANDRPVVAWVDSTPSPSGVYVRRWDGNSWLELGGSASNHGIGPSGVGGVGTPRVAMDASDQPVVAWYQSIGGVGQIYVASFSGTAWTGFAGSAAGNGISDASYSASQPCLAIDSSGLPWVAYRHLESGATPAEIYVAHFDSLAWSFVDHPPVDGASLSVSATDTPSAYPTLLLLSNDLPVVGWQETTANGEDIYVKLKEASAWSEYGLGSASGGGISATTTGSDSPVFAVGPNNLPVAAWVEWTGGASEIYVRRWDGNAWSELTHGSGGGVSNTDTRSTYPSLALHANGPALVWDERVTTGTVYGKRWSRSAWRAILSGSASGNGIPGSAQTKWNSRVAVTPSAHAIVAWLEMTPNPQVLIAEQEATGWVSIGPDSMGSYGISATGGAQSMDLVLDDTGLPVVAWQDDSSMTDQIYVLRYDGSDWVELSTGSASAGGISNNAGSSQAPSLAIDASGQPVVAWQDDSSGSLQILVRRFDGNGWVEAGSGSGSGTGVSNSPSAARSPSLAVTSGGELAVAWEEQVTAGEVEIFARYLAGNAWDPLGSGSASGLGVSDGTGFSSIPSLAADDTGRLGLAWVDYLPGRPEIYFLLFEPGTGEWRPVRGSQSGGGVSRSAEASLWPEVSAVGDLFCVAWSELGAVESEVLMRCTDGS